jgi:quinol monooxygenase YgiN
MAVIAIAEMFGISGRRPELATLLERFGGWAGGEPGCRRYIFAATLTDPSRFVLVSEWETQEALDTHYRSEAFADFQLSLDGLLARPSESGETVNTVVRATVGGRGRVSALARTGPPLAAILGLAGRAASRPRDCVWRVCERASRGQCSRPQRLRRKPCPSARPKQ